MLSSGLHQDFAYWSKVPPMKFGYFKMSTIYLSDTYEIPTLARHLPIHIKHTEIVSDIKNPKV